MYRNSQHGSVGIILLILIVILLIAGGGYLLVFQKNTNNRVVDVKRQESVDEQESGKTDTQEWKATSFMGAYTFEYPYGWHVSSNWPSYEGEQTEIKPIVVAIDSEPISGAPRDGPLGKVEIRDWNGLQNPEAKLSDRISLNRDQLKEGYLDETVPGAISIRHLKGKLVGPFWEDTPLEVYLLMLTAGNQTDKMNYRVIEVASYNDVVPSDVLERIAKSIKSQTQ